MNALVVAVALVIVAVVAFAGLQSVRLAETRAALSSTTEERDAAWNAVRVASLNRAAAEKALAEERAVAVAAEKRASELRLRIAKDAGTDRDGPVAPVLLDTLRDLRGDGR